MRVPALFAPLVLSALLPLAARADTISFSLVGVDTNVTADVDFSYTAATGIVDITLTNTSPNNGGLEDPRLTGFGFNTPGTITGFSAFSGPSGWSPLFDADDIDTPGNFGFFDLGASSGPNEGIASGASRSFQFVLTGGGLAGYTASSFLDLVSAGGNQNTEHQSFFGRFQRVGADGNGSDVAFPGAPVPEPTSALVFTAALLVVRGAYRRGGSIA
jgi:hypothetical protein